MIGRWPARAIVSFFVLTMSVAGCGGTRTVGGGLGRLTDPSVEPAVLSTDPPENSRGPYPGLDADPPVVIVRFNKIMDLSSLRSAARLIDTRDHKEVDIDISSITGDVVYLKPRNGISREIGLTYTLIIDSTARDIGGRRLHSTFAATFEPEPSFRVRSIAPSNGASDISPLAAPETSLTIRFNSQIDSSIFGHVLLSPPMGGQWQETDASTIGRRLRGFTDAGTTYDVKIDTGAHDRYGNRLAEPFSSTFSTTPFGIAGSLPSDGSTDVPTSSTITIIPTAPVDTSSVRTSFSIEPAVDGTFLFSPEQFVFIPSKGLAAGTVYSVRLGTALRSVSGKALPSPLVIAFSTQPGD